MNKPTYDSQYHEDKYLDKIFRRSRGFCIEIGGFDNIAGSTTYFFEKLGWDCLVVEPLPHLCQEIITNRKCNVLNYAISSQSGARELNKQKIQLIKLDDISSKFPSGFELNVLNGGFNFISNCLSMVIIEIAFYRNDSIQNNYVVDIFLFMKSAGFTLINVYDVACISSRSYLGLGQMDCVFINSSIVKN